jgi:hypothetical protein
MRKKWALTLAIFLIALSITGSILFYRYDSNVGLSRSQWPTTSGTVTYYKEEWRPRTDDRWRYVDYAYEVNGRQYYGKQEWMASEKAPTFSEGQIVTIFYNPEKPEISVIEPWWKSQSFGLATMWVYLGSAIATICAIIIFVVNRRQPW